jgi:prepilin-type N-terminal cleavage/methylation domain-containing protein
MRHFNRSKGFTIIELLVVIAIVGLLSSIILASLSSARSKGNDGRRAADLHQVQLALSLYYLAKGNYPPSNCGGVDGNFQGWASVDPAYLSCWNTVQTELAPYIKRLPNDPRNSIPDDYIYWYASTLSGKGYVLLATFERAPNAGVGCYPSYYCIGENWLQ